MKRLSTLTVLIVASAIAAMTQFATAATVQLFYASGRPQVEFAVVEIRTSLGSQGDSVLRGNLETQLATPVQGSFRIVIAASVEQSGRVVRELRLDPPPSNAVAQAYSIANSMRLAAPHT